jgi:hypothetical protein
MPMMPAPTMGAAVRAALPSDELDEDPDELPPDAPFPEVGEGVAELDDPESLLVELADCLLALMKLAHATATVTYVSTQLQI